MSQVSESMESIFRAKLEQYESETPNGFFDKLMFARAQMGDMRTDALLREKLHNFETPVSATLFDSLMNTRAQMGDMPTDASLREKLQNFETPISESLFDNLIRSREGSDETLEDIALRHRLQDHLTHVSPRIYYNLMAERDRKRRRLAYWRSATAAILLLGFAYFLINNLELKTGNSEAEQSIEQNTEGGLSTKNEELKIKSQQSYNDIQNTNSNEPDSKSTGIITPRAQSNKEMGSQISDGQGVLQIEKQDLQGSKLSNIQYPTESLPSTWGIKNSSLDIKDTEGLTSIKNEELKIENLDLLQLDIYRLKNILLTPSGLHNPCADPGFGCPGFDKKRRSGPGENAFYLDVYAAPEYAFRRLTQNAPEMTQYLQGRDTVERPWYALSAGVRASFVFGNGMAVRAGFAYAQNNEVATFDSFGIGRIEKREIITIQPNGIRDTVFATDITSGIFRSTRYNRYRSFDIPIQVGYELALTHDWSMGLNGGVNINIAAWQKADIVGANLKKQTATNQIGEISPVFRNRLGISVFGSVAAYRQLTGNLQLVIEPSVRYYLKPITQPTYELKQQYINAGLILGVRYQF